MRLVVNENLDRLSLTDWAVLALLKEAPAHPFAVSRHLARDGDLGRILTVRRPLVYRSLDRLVTLGLAVPQRTEPGNAGPRRTVHRVTRLGRSRLLRWLDEPVHSVRDLRIEFLLKVTLLLRSGRTVQNLVERQADVLDQRLTEVEMPSAEHDVVDLWRKHNAAATRAFLSDPFFSDPSAPA